MSLILGAQSAVATGYSIDNSVKFDSGASADMVRVISTDGDTLKLTFNCWIKRSHIPDDTKNIITNKNVAGTRVFTFGWLGGSHTERLLLYNYDGSGEDNKRTEQAFKDTSGWYNYHFIWDSANGDSTLRSRLFVNGTEVTVWDENDEPPLNDECMLVAGTQCPEITLGSRIHNDTYFDGYMAQPILCDGQAYLPTKFGEFNEDSPTIWQPIDPADGSLSFGTHGFWLDFKDSADLGADVSGEGNDFTPTGIVAADQATDTPTNNFATWNNLYMPTANRPVFSEGNCKVLTSASGNWGSASTWGMSAGKWYAEFEAVSASNTPSVGITASGTKHAYSNIWVGNLLYDYAYFNDGSTYNNNSQTSSWGDTYTAGDIIGVALDLTNLKLYFAKNGTWQDSGDPTSGATGTGAAYTIAAPAQTPDEGVSEGTGEYFFACSDQSSGSDTWAANFGGCPSFTVSSGNADENGYGNFEYTPPSGYLALCTKNLGSDGG